MNNSVPGISQQGLKGQVLRWRRRVGARLAKPQLLWLTAAGLDAAAHAGQSVDLVASEQLLQHLVCEPGLPLADEAALQGYARQLFGHYFGPAAQRWALAGWRAGGAAGASALHGLDMAALCQSLAQQQAVLHGLRPAWAAVLQQQAAEQPDWRRAPQAALAWVEGGLLSWLSLRAGVVQALRHQRLAAATVLALHEALSELKGEQTGVLLLGYGLDAAQMPGLPGVRQLAPLDGTAPRLDWFARPAQPWAEAPQPEFAREAAPRSRLAWPLAVSGALVLATALWSAWDSRVQREAAQERVATLSAQLQRQPAAAPPRGSAPAQAALEQERLRAAAEVQRLLQTPWSALLANVEQAGLSEPPAATISWLGLDYTAARRELRLDGLASDQALALQLVERLRAAPGWGDVVLSRFQTAGEGLVGQRFDLGARLQPELLRDELPRVSRSRQELALQ
jgi:hypothetical protein